MLAFDDMDIPNDAVGSADGIAPPAGVATAGGIAPRAAAGLVGCSAAGPEGVDVGARTAPLLGRVLAAAVEQALVTLPDPPEG